MDGFVQEPCIPLDDLTRMSTVGKANQKYGLVARPLRVYTGVQQTEFWTARFTESIFLWVGQIKSRIKNIYSFSVNTGNLKYGHEAK